MSSAGSQIGLEIKIYNEINAYSVTNQIGLEISIYTKLMYLMQVIKQN